MLRDNPYFIVWSHIPNRGRLLLLSSLSAGIRSVAMLAVPYLLASVIDGALGGAVPLTQIGGIILFQVLVAITDLRIRSRVLSLTKESVLDLRRRMLRAILGWSILEIRATDHARLGEFFENGITRLDAGMRQILFAVVPGVLILTSGVVYLLIVAPVSLVAVCLVGGALLGLVIFSEAKRVRQLVEAVVESGLSLRTGFSAWLQGALLHRSRALDERETDRMVTSSETFRDITFTAVLAMARRTEVQSIGTIVLICLALVVGGKSVLDGSMSPGDLAASMAVLAMLRGPAQQLADAWSSVAEGATGARMAEEVLANTSRRPIVGTLVPASADVLQADAVMAGYGDRQVLDRVSVEIRVGEVVALMGANGSGKSTLGRIMTGLQEPNGGAVRLGDVSLQQLAPDWLSAQVGYLPQEPFLLPSTVEENIRFHRGGIDTDDLLRAYHSAGLELLLGPADAGLGLSIAQDASNISTGQRQGIALASALASSPRFLVLDEPTSHMASDLAELILQRIRSLPTRPGVLLITHREADLKVADRIVYLTTDRADRAHHAANSLDEGK